MVGIRGRRKEKRREKRTKRLDWIVLLSPKEYYLIGCFAFFDSMEGVQQAERSCECPFSVRRIQLRRTNVSWIPGEIIKLRSGHTMLFWLRSYGGIIQKQKNPCPHLDACISTSGITFAGYEARVKNSRQIISAWYNMAPRYIAQ